MGRQKDIRTYPEYMKHPNGCVFKFRGTHRESYNRGRLQAATKEEYKHWMDKQEASDVQFVKSSEGVVKPCKSARKEYLLKQGWIKATSNEYKNYLNQRKK